jgi:iron complex transport system substrate-binding protein
VTARLAVPAALLAALAVGCGERQEPLGAVAQRYPVTEPGAGERPTVLAKRPERIVALDPGSTELLIALGARERLVGVPAGFRRGSSPSQAPPSAKQVLTEALEVRIGEVARLQPDLIVATPATDLLDLTRAQRRTHAAVYVQPSLSLDDVVRATLELGSLVGDPVRARQLAGDIRTKADDVEARIAQEPIVTVFVDTGFFISVPERSLLGDLVRRAKGKSVAGADPGLEPFPLRRLRRLDPDVYLAISDSRVSLETLRSNSQTSKLTAVRKRRFTAIPSDLAHRAGPRVGIALERVAKALHPDAFG